jgi:hypothetical protein
MTHTPTPAADATMIEALRSIAAILHQPVQVDSSEPTVQDKTKVQILRADCRAARYIALRAINAATLERTEQ